MKKCAHYLALFVFLTVVTIACASPGSAQPSAVESFRNALVDYFAQLNYVPVLVNRGYTVGDVVEADGVNFFARASRCFPGLQPPKPVQTALTDVLQTHRERSGGWGAANFLGSTPCKAGQ
jgi:hypothetical protein